MNDLTRPRRVGLLLDYVEFHHKIFLGVLEFSRLYRTWMLDRALALVSNLERFAESGIDGIIGKLTDPEMRERVVSLGIPAVNISAAAEVSGIPSVLANDVMIGQLAADHLYSRGCAHYGFVGQYDLLFVHRRRRGFHQRLGELGCGYLYDEFLNAGLPEPSLNQTRNTPLGRWLLNLPKPVGLLCSTDTMAFCVHRIARDCGLEVGREVVLLGVDNQLDYCESVHPPISSIEHGMTGFRAAEALERLMLGHSVPPVLLVPPKGVVVRSEEPAGPALPSEVQAMMQLISSRAGEALQINDLLAGLPLSRRYVEKRFKAATGRSIYQEVQRQRIERACQMLRTTHWPMERVSAAAGFSDPRQFSRAFRRYMGTTPSAYRRAHARPAGARPSNAAASVS